MVMTFQNRELRRVPLKNARLCCTKLPAWMSAAPKRELNGAAVLMNPSSVRNLGYRTIKGARFKTDGSREASALSCRCPPEAYRKTPMACPRNLLPLLPMQTEMSCC